MINYCSEFESYLNVVKKASKNTIDAYIKDLNKYISYSEERNIKDLSIVSLKFLESYLIYLSDAGATDRSISRTRSSLNCFYKFLYSINKCELLKIPNILPKESTTKELPVILSHDEISELIDCVDTSDLKGIRDKAMLQLLYAVGIKVSELIELKISDVNLEFGLINIGNRRLPVYPMALKSLSLYIKEVRSIIASDTDKLFVNMLGTELTRQGVWKIIKVYSLKAGISKTITPNTIRHTFAVHLLENGASVDDVCEMLGFSDISSATMYIKLIKSKHNNKLLDFHPMNQK